ncbi:MAG: hypothetical protein HXY35_03025 [Chloroflexi bacterium]|nr:hypothetical protein [Chloroflexota bacterium]
MNGNLLHTVFKAVAFGMGILTVNTAMTFWGIGVTTLAMAELQKESR